MTIYISDNLIIENFIRALKKGETGLGGFVISYESAKQLLKDLKTESPDIWGYGMRRGVSISSYYKDIKDGVCFTVIEASCRTIKFLKDSYEEILTEKEQ